ncbi:hypothetical protein STCU_11754 [Strigomonas culicis]|uniref:Uncharacterized protein n=1 Tax=Strigomonas culicis TaxID=28005 RepID=S9UM71_9TRYP|nr:hypothetical protein STCU_11754 [Strigomonas culicis]|eukprot:EPY15801.1 hypothetical protein STCU_11754 [Strigomonas culicis]
MSKKKYNSTEPGSTHRWVLDPKDLVVLQSKDGECFAIDQNCARVSRFCRQYMDEAEMKIEKGMNGSTSPFMGPTATW